MDKMSKFRRKPKPPAIETSIDRNISQIADSVSVEHAADLTQQPQQKPFKKSAFRNLRLRGSAKRARDSSPAELPSSPPPPAVVAQDGMSPRKTQRFAALLDGLPPNKSLGHDHPDAPAFLNLSLQDIENKFQEITWAERNRVAQGMRNEGAEDSQWTLYKQSNTQEKGVMDRYVNIKPWIYNRIKLRVPENEFDYVNASSVTLTSPLDANKPPLRYIAMQGPTELSFDYVWRMIAEQTDSPAVIVQLTSMVEAGTIKCHQYFPSDDGFSTWDLNEDDLWADDWKAQLKFDSLEELADGAIEKRKLLLHVEGEEKPRVIWHFLYKCWPDFGVPTLEDLDSFLELMILSHQYSDPSSPRIVHCSAGVGRTGTFICLEHLIRELDSGTLEGYDSSGGKSDLIYDAVDSLRQQRRGMVQGEIQYQFIYQVMRKLWQDKYGPPDEDTSGSEPAAKRLEVADPFVDAGPGPDIGATVTSAVS